MMRIVVAEEGRELEPDAEFQEIYQQGNLSLALQSLTGVAAASQLIYLHSGEQLREDNTEELLVTPDLTLYIFNSDLVGAGNHPPAELLVAPDETLPLSGNLIHDAETHLAHIRSLGVSVGIQHESLSVIVRNIESHLAVLADTFDSFRNVAQLELDRQQSLLRGHKLDLEIIAKVKVHPEFLSATVRRQVEATGRERTLGDYVSTSKMQMVAESCARLHDDLSTRYSSAVDSFDRLVASVAELKVRLDSSFSSNVASFISQAEGVMSDLRSGQSAFGILVQHANDSALTPMNATVLANQSRLVQIYREACIVKNDSTAHVFAFLSDVSDIHRLMSGIPEVLASLESDFRQKGGFPHLQRLHSMLHMYGATVIEVVRRREFSRFFLEKAQAIAEVLAKLSSHERKRRQVYRSEVHGQLPFDPRGMDEPAPTLEISTSGGEELAIAIERQDIATFLDLVSQIERTSNMMDLPQGFVHPAAEASVAFERLVARLDSLESDFDRLAERAVLSASRIYQSRRQSTTDQSSIQSLVDQLREARAAKTEQEISFQRETAHLKDEIERLRAEAGTVSGTRQRLERLEIELDVTRTKHANEVAVRQGLEKRVKDVERARNEAERRAESEAVQFDASKLATLEAEKAEFASSLNRLQVHNGRLEEELERLRGEKDSLSQAVREKDGMLKEQATTAERSLRDHIAETDGDRAVLEQQVAELRRALEYQNSIEVQKLQQQLSRLEQENRLLETKLAASNGTALKLATAARELYDGQVQALSAAQSVLKASKANPIATDAESPTIIVPTIELPAPLPEFDSTNPEAMIAALTGVSPKLLGEVVVKIGSNARKYLKLSKEYRDRSKSKIAFRNFSRGDLALFLPTRNSIAKPWAAFNVAFPHYFLNATEDISELLKSREWIVARILSITERIADSKQPDGNPFGLGDGVKFHLLDVEDWTQPSNVAKKRTNSNPTRPISIASYEARERISSWSETTALATALPHSLSDREGEVVRLGARAPSPPGPPSRYFSKLSVSPSAGPSSLSKVLAQAPTPSSPRPSSTISNTRNHERSRSRTTSLSSVRRPQLGVGGSNKAAATIALSDPIAPATPSTATAAATPEDADVPSPSGSAFDGMGSVVLSRRRPSLSPGMSAGSTLANIASNWGLPLGRKRAQEQARASPVPSEIE